MPQRWDPRTNRIGPERSPTSLTATRTPCHFFANSGFVAAISVSNRDTVVASEHARDLFHLSNERYLLRWREEFRERARVFDLEPGQGAYMPSTSPHMVENGDEPSITASFTYYTEGTRRDALLHKAHALLRRARITPPAVVHDSAFDTAMHAVASMLSRRLRPLEFAEVATS